MRQGITVTNRKYLLRAYEKCFVGSDASEWLQKSGDAETAEKANCIGNQMVKAGVIHHVLDEHDFEDDYLFYR